VASPTGLATARRTNASAGRPDRRHRERSDGIDRRVGDACGPPGQRPLQEFDPSADGDGREDGEGDFYGRLLEKFE